MESGWTISGTGLVYKAASGELYFPSAAEIYSCINGFCDKIEGVLKDCENPKTIFPNIRFSRIGSPLVCKLQFEDNSGNIVLKLDVNRKNKTYPVKYIEGRMLDHCITDKEWFYISGSCEEIATLLKKAGIDDFSDTITMKHYLSLLQLQRALPAMLIEDEVGQSLSKKPISAGTEIPKSVIATLYPYQRVGFCWMDYMLREGCGCILGDEMGLGKTLQIITLITERNNKKKRPALIISPVSLLENWLREFKKFSPEINVYIHHGPKRTGRYQELVLHDVVIISYNTAINDLSLLRMIKWDIIAVDEAQNIKNPHAERTKSIKRIPCYAAIAITGTPLENHMSDIWSLVDFVASGFLGTLGEFNQNFPDSMGSAEKIEPILSAFMIRRRVSEVAQDLPERVDIPQAIIMSEIECLKYEEERKRIIEDMDGKIVSLPQLQKLRMYCTHPFLLNRQMYGDPLQVSIKYERLCNILEEIISIKEKVIMFTSYNEMFNILLEDIPKRFSIPVLMINGSTPVEERQPTIDRFTDSDDSALLVLNPRAAGTGLNITTANHVIHYNLEWNPALEDQASARAYRRGQKKVVFVHRLYYANTIEQIINDRIEYKRLLSETAVVGSTGNNKNMDDILAALKLSPLGGYL
jgi:SNF2 family DNA or RNA helicase